MVGEVDLMGLSFGAALWGGECGQDKKGIGRKQN